MPTPARETALTDLDATRPPVDFALLTEITGEDDRGELLAMLEFFLEELQELLPPLDAALAAQNRAAVRNAAHAAKSAASSAAATPLADLLDRVETSAASADWAVLGALAQEVRDEHARLVAFCAVGPDNG